MPLAAQRRARRVAAAVIPTAALLATALTSAAPADAAATSSSIAVSHPSWATPQADKGAVPASTRITARVYFASQNAAGLDAFAKAVSDPSSAQYGKYLSATQAAAKFGPSAANSAAVKSYLTGHGLSVTATDEHYIDIAGTAAQVEAAFNTGLHNYATTTGLHHAPTSNLTLPDSVAKGLLSVVGLDGVPEHFGAPGLDLGLQVHRHQERQHPGHRRPRALLDLLGSVHGDRIPDRLHRERADGSVLLRPAAAAQGLRRERDRPDR